MRIAYVILNLGKTAMLGGVGRKVAGQIHAWRSMQNEADCFLLTPDVLDLPDIKPFIFYSQGRLPPHRLVRREFSRVGAILRLISAVKAYHPDIIYLRYARFAYPLQDLFKVAPTVVEINSNDVEESRYSGRVSFFLNLLGRREILRRVSGIVAISNEIAYLPENVRFNKPVTVIANGVDLSRYQPIPAPVNTSPRIVLVGTPGLAWHGVDKIWRLAEKCPDLYFEVIGYGPEDVDVSVPNNIRLHGFLSQEEVAMVLRRADVACGSLALHRKKMQEASPLKVREALAFGIPVLLAYTDTDLWDGDFDFVLQIPNQEDNVITHASQIRDFAYRMRGRRADRTLLKSRIDQRSKEQKRLSFFESVI